MAKQAKIGQNKALNDDSQKQQKSVNLRKALWDKIDLRASKENRTLSNIVETVLEKEFA